MKCKPASKKKKKNFQNSYPTNKSKVARVRPQIFLPVPRADNEKKNTKHLSLKNYSIECQKVIWDCSDFPLFYSVIGPKDSRHSRNQSDAKLKPITAWSPALSRALGGSVGFYCEFCCLFECIVEKRILKWT